MEQAMLKSILLYAPNKGVFYWITPPSGHSELLGEEAGCARPGVTGKAYHNIQIHGVKYKRSRLAFLYMQGCWPSNQIDHINGDSLDDRWFNLRDVTATQNAWNHKKRAKRSDLPMGVRANKSGRFSARIAVNGQSIQIGTFDTAQQAEEAYRKAREKYYGEFA